MEVEPFLYEREAGLGLELASPIGKSGVQLVYPVTKQPVVENRGVHSAADLPLREYGVVEVEVALAETGRCDGPAVVGDAGRQQEDAGVAGHARNVQDRHRPSAAGS